MESIETLLSECPATSKVYLLDMLLQEEKGVIDLDEMVMPKEWLEELEPLRK